jgi:alpha-glucosidase
MRALMEEYKERVLIGEIYLPIKQLVRYYGEEMPEVTVPLLGAHMPFNFHLIQRPWDADSVAGLIREYEEALPDGAWPNWVLGNHDQTRLATRVGWEQARVAAVLLLTLRGTPTMYYGDELGMPDARIAPQDVRDPAARNGPGRDPERSPMLWENRENAGFTVHGVATWLPMVWDWPQFTVESEETGTATMLQLYRRLLALRRERPELHAGGVCEVTAEAGVLGYVRALNGKRVQVFLNMTDEERWVDCAPGKVLLSSFLDRENVVTGSVELRRDEAVVIELENVE